MTTTPELTPAQQAALDALPPKRRAFVLAYVGEARGNATEAARLAGYAHATSQGSRLLTFVEVADAIVGMRAPEDARAIETVEGLRRYWTSVMRGEVQDSQVTRDGRLVAGPASVAMRLRASELLGKSLGAFLERHEITGAGGGLVRVVFGSIAHAEAWARDAPDAPRS